MLSEWGAGKYMLTEEHFIFVATESLVACWEHLLLNVTMQMVQTVTWILPFRATNPSTLAIFILRTTTVLLSHDSTKHDMEHSHGISFVSCSVSRFIIDIFLWVMITWFLSTFFISHISSYSIFLYSPIKMLNVIPQALFSAQQLGQLILTDK